MNEDDRSGARLGELSEVLGKSMLFRGISLESIAFLLPCCPILELAAGARLLARGAANDSVFVLLAGELRVHLLQPGEAAITTIREGECAGEMSVIDGGAASADVLADRPSRVLQIPQEVLWSMVNVSHGVARNLLHILSTRMRFDNDLIVQNLHARRQFELAAQVDALTGLHNRRWLNDAFARQMSRCREDGLALALVMLDVDFFKRINDGFGHVAGDHALVAVAGVLAGNLRPMDLVARYGGEEFALGLPNTELADALTVAERLRRAVEALNLPFLADKPLPHLTISLGVARMQPEQTLEALLTTADAALYRAKAAGRNRVLT